jgi:chromosome segregation ATPase
MLIKMPCASDAENIAKLVKGYKKEVQLLKGRCSALERTVEDLKSSRDSHQRMIESYRQEVIQLKVLQGTLNTDFQGEKFGDMHLQ